MKTLTLEESCEVPGGLIGGGTTRSGVPLYDASSTREPGQSSGGETIPGGAEFYNFVMGNAELQMQIDQALQQQVNSCTTGNLLVCAVNTFQVLNGQLNLASRRYP